ncbi:MAG: hypothetical protein EON93_13935 [Burkholderiales bacterium]|nr:MAG: hypothetical protein EON93_13935 [Burkholderiales bacterium]
MWHSYANASEIRAGSRLLITGGDQAVNLSAADMLAIELPDGRTADVVFCESGRLVIHVELETPVELLRVEDEAASSLTSDFQRGSADKPGWSSSRS